MSESTFEEKVKLILGSCVPVAAKLDFATQQIVDAATQMTYQIFTQAIELGNNASRHDTGETVSNWKPPYSKSYLSAIATNTWSMINETPVTMGEYLGRNPEGPQEGISARLVERKYVIEARKSSKEEWVVWDGGASSSLAVATDLAGKLVKAYGSLMQFRTSPVDS